MARQAIDDTRPAGEAWDVTIIGPTEDLIRFDFRRGTDAPRSLSLVVQDDEASRRVIYASLTRFLRREWPGGLAEH